MKLTNLFGFRREPENERSARHWDFRQTLGPKLTALTGDKASDMRQYSSPRHNQLNSSSCVGNSVVKALEIKRIMKYGDPAHVDLSRLAIYYLARELMDPQETLNDKGTFISLAADALRRFGICTEADWPFDISKITSPPTWRAMRGAYVHKISAWYKIKSLGLDRVKDVIDALASGYPVVYGTEVGDNWLQYRGKDPLGLPGDVLGGHATVLVGWNPSKNIFIGENSWGIAWGIDGFYELREEVISGDTSHDFIVIQAPWE